MCNIKKPHVHAEVIRAYADGAEIEYFLKLEGRWETINYPSFLENQLYRVKPEITAFSIYAAAAYPQYKGEWSSYNKKSIERGLEAVVKAVKAGIL